MSTHTETWEDHENSLAAAETMAILEQQAMERATTLETTASPADEALLARRRDFQIEITPNRHPAEAGEVRVGITYNGHSWSSFVLTREERTKLVDALVTAKV
jgi:hypothetical protein